MTFEERQAKIVEFCKTPRTTKQVMEEFGMGEQGVYRCMRFLKESGHVVKQQDVSMPNNYAARYAHTGKPYEVKNKHAPTTRGVMICGVKF